MKKSVIYGLIVAIAWGVLGCTPTEYNETELVGRKQVERPIQAITLGEPDDCGISFPPLTTENWENTYELKYKTVKDPLIVPVQQFDTTIHGLEVHHLVPYELPNDLVAVSGRFASDADENDFMGGQNAIALINLDSTVIEIESIHHTQDNGMIQAITWSEPNQSLFFLSSNTGYTMRNNRYVREQNLSGLSLKTNKWQDTEVIRGELQSQDFIELNPLHGLSTHRDDFYPSELYLLDNNVTHQVIAREQNVDRKEIDFYGATTPRIEWSADSNMIAILHPKIGVELVDLLQSTSCLIPMPVAKTMRGEETFTFHYVIRWEWSDDGKYAAILTYRAADPTYSINPDKVASYEAQRTELFILDVAEKKLHYATGSEDGFYRIREIDWVPGTDKLIFESVVKPYHLLPTSSLEEDGYILSYPQNGYWSYAMGTDGYGLFLADVSEQSVQRVHDRLIFPRGSDGNIWYDDEKSGKTLLTGCMSGLCQIDFGFALDE